MINPTAQKLNFEIVKVYLLYLSRGLNRLLNLKSKGLGQINGSNGAPLSALAQILSLAS